MVKFLFLLQATVALRWKPPEIEAYPDGYAMGPLYY
jgi:hypothetical protein